MPLDLQDVANPIVTLPILFESIHTNLASLGNVWVENLSQEEACRGMSTHSVERHGNGGALCRERSRG